MNDNFENLDSLKNDTAKYERRNFGDIKKRVRNAKGGNVPQFVPASKKKTGVLKVLGGTLVAAALLVVLGITTVNTLNSHQDALVKEPYYAVYEAMKESTEKRAEAYGGNNLVGGITRSFGLEDGGIAVEEAAPADEAITTDFSYGNTDLSAPVSEAAFGETNVQVEGIDEADIVKNDGENLYIISSYTTPDYEYKTMLSIVRAKDLILLSQKEFIEKKDGVIIDMYVKNGRMVLVSSLPAKEPDISAAEDSTRIWVQSNDTMVKVFEILNSGDAISMERDFRQEGNYVSSRLSGDTVYLVTSKQISHTGIIPLEKIVTYVPYVYDTLSKEHPREYLPVTEDQITIAEDNDSTFITASAISMVDNTQVVTETVLGSYASHVYCNSQSLYVAASNGEGTEILRFVIDGNNIEYAAKATVDGYVNNQFSMDEHNGYFRIATTAWSNTSQSSKLYVLDSGLNKVGESEALAPNEDIKSVRFMGNMTYIVTFRQTDPLFAIDATDPFNPVVLGQLKIPGFSTYMHPLDETTLIGVGYNADEETGWQTGMKFSLFDVSDPYNPQETSKLILNGSIYSDALYQHKAVTFIKDKGLLIVPYSFYDEFVTVGDQKITKEFSNGAMVLNVTKEGGFVLKGIVTDPKFGEFGDAHTNESRYVMRSSYWNDLLYTISNQSVVAVNMNDLSFFGQTDMYETSEFEEQNFETPEPEPTADPNDYSDLEPFQDYGE